MEETLKDTIKHRFVEIEQKPSIGSMPSDFVKKLGIQFSINKNII
jgi:hypothetical protein